jgi:hypothetical protein
VLDALKEKATQAQTQERELEDMFHTLVGYIEEACALKVAWDKPHVSVGGLLDEGLVLGKGHFWKIREGRKNNMCEGGM